jgi:hypothetical protein
MKKLLVAIVIGALLALPLSAMAMEKIDGAGLEDVTGQAGVSIGFGNTMITAISFSSLSWGDPDGVTGATGAAWLVIDGDVTLTTTISQGGILAMDVAYTAAGVTLNGVNIPATTAFLALSLPTTSIAVSVPDQLAIGFNTTAGSLGCTLGLLNLGGLTVTVSSVDDLYVWCHD